MSETNINAYKEELTVALRDLDRAKARVAELRGYIESVEPQESEEVSDEAVEVKTSKKGGKK